MNDRYTLDHRAQVPSADTPPTLHHSRLYLTAHLLQARQRTELWSAHHGGVTACAAARKVLGIGKRPPPYGRTPMCLVAPGEVFHAAALGLGIRYNDIVLHGMRAQDPLLVRAHCPPPPPFPLGALGGRSVGLPQLVWQGMLDALPHVPYRRSLTAIKWQALKMAAHKKATIVFPLMHLLHEVAAYAYTLPDALQRRLDVGRVALTLVCKAFFCSCRGEARQLAALAHELYPRLLVAFQGLGGEAPNFRVPPPPPPSRLERATVNERRRGRTFAPSTYLCWAARCA